MIVAKRQEGNFSAMSWQELDTFQWDDDVHFVLHQWDDDVHFVLHQWDDDVHFVLHQHNDFFNF